MSFFSISQNDRLPIARVELTDASGAINLSNSNVYFIYRGKYQTGVSPTTGLADIVSATSGIAEYAWTTDDVAVAGIFYCYWMTSGTNGKLSKFPNDSYIRYVINPLL
jgi:hypothetical protein